MLAHLSPRWPYFFFRNKEVDLKIHRAMQRAKSSRDNLTYRPSKQGIRTDSATTDTEREERNSHIHDIFLMKTI